jgi:hypothetical protein
MPLASRAEIYDDLKGKFGAVLMVTDGKVGVPLQSVSPNMKLVGIIKFVGCRPNAKGYCDIEADIRVRNPDGKIGEHIEHNKLKNQKAPAPGEIVTGWVFGFGFDDADPPGKYKVEATIRDFVAGQIIDLSNELNLSR